MAASHVRLICKLTSAVALAAALGALTIAAQGPDRPPKQVAPKLDAVLPLLNASVVRVRATTNLTGVRVADDLAVVFVPGSSPMPASFEVALFGGWLPAQVESSDPAQRLVLLRLAGKREPAPALTPADLPPGADFVVTAGWGRHDTGHQDRLARARRARRCAAGRSGLRGRWAVSGVGDRGRTAAAAARQDGPAP